eukprot:8607391-Ditylum_brightwellii.AAC.2
MYTHLSKCGFPPKLNVMDNEASLCLNQAMTNTNTKYQLWSTDPNFPIFLQDLLIPQSVLTLNLLHSSCLNPKLSAHAQLNGNHDFNAVPLTPPGARAIIFGDPDERGSWAPHGTDGWYVGPVPEHCHCYCFYIQEIRATHIEATADFSPVHCAMPKLLSADAAILAAKDVIQVLNNSAPVTPFQSLTTDHHCTLQQLAQIFNNVTTLDADPTLERS